ncbi:MAG: hypothetical protein HY052_08010 [Proteobacteria bacterium]|nr:hypothetical protein [Pseudomonadota bacterium]
MQEILKALSGNMDTLGLSLATAISTGIVLALRALFALARKLAQKTPTTIDDKIVDETEAALRNKSQDI